MIELAVPFISIRAILIQVSYFVLWSYYFSELYYTAGRLAFTHCVAPPFYLKASGIVPVSTSEKCMNNDLKVMHTRVIAKHHAV